VLRDIESKLAGLVEGTFGRLFRSEVTPAELARGLAREMETTRRQGLDRTWVADHYDVYLSPADHRRIAAGPGTLAEELAADLVLHAREQRFALAHAPRVVFHVGQELPTSRYGVRAVHTEVAAPEPERAVAERPAPVERAAPRPATGRTPPVPRRQAEPPVERAPARPRAGGDPGAATAIVLATEGRREPVPLSGGIVGRGRDADVVIASAEVSRQHMELRPRGPGWVVWDLGSTNGVRLNGRPVGGPGEPAAVAPGDRLELGTVVLRVEDGA
jgi:hypothetical protein